MTRERDRYRRASLREQVGDALHAFWGDPLARFITIVLLGGLLVLRLLTPEIVPFSALQAGDCVYLRPPGPTDMTTSVKPVPATSADLQAYDAAERAQCDLSHSHEVSDAFSVGEPGTAYPGLAALVDANQPRCDTAFEPYVGRALEGSAHATALAVPGEAAWAAGARHGVCFVYNADRSLLDHPARGSGG
ncbi:MAG TPA: septum formation family protein [Candidatus Limnocylindrales bacterium]|nr:septum formation family protein [Candidatus Limnocylindrales bacterium]